MTLDKPAVRERLRKFDFSGVFTQELGWDFPGGNMSIRVGDAEFLLRAVAQKRGIQVFECTPSDGGAIPDYVARRKIERQVAKLAYEHLLIFTDRKHTKQIWQWVARKPGEPAQYREHPYEPAHQSGEALIQKLSHIYIPLNEEESLDLTGAIHKLRDAFDRDKVTKKFYDRFKAEHAAFQKLIKGIKVDADLQWYTSLMLNRLMFVYFIQKKGFLDGDVNYLQNRMQRVRALKGHDQFLSFYQYFLLRLFHEGLGKHKLDRQLDPTLETLVGKVPYLNGGFFEVHELERRYPGIDIPDKAFKELFAFFDDFSWHLDERPLRAGNEINPDVVGYIFEKYINQKQMGAYYTKEDITEYISKNTIIPFLFNAAEKKCPVAFKPGSFLWSLLSDNPDRYIYDAVRHGVVDGQGNLIPLPAEIEAGVMNVAKRDGWNKPAPAPFSLPTETWREHVARRTRCLEVREKLKAGEVHAINDLITLNLNIWQFARDAIVESEGPELLRAFWEAIAGRVPEKSNEKFEPGITVLDPTCGSGAFLFAALRILETLYTDCIERMTRFVDDLTGKSRPEKFVDFKAVLAQIAKHSDRYFILKSIIINNLFGVDIMEEAVEICKLRLFLKLAAQVERFDQIEPLPDIDFNIRCGNTLVGYVSLREVRTSQIGTLGFAAEELARIEEDAMLVDRAFQQFRAQQTLHGGTVSADDKQGLRHRLAKLDQELDGYLAGEYGIDSNDTLTFEQWKADKQPFHWFVEFHGIIERGGFDAVIGNPPYVSTTKVDYLSARAKSLKLPDLYAHVLLRSVSISAPAGRFGMIVPLSVTFSEDFAPLRNTLTALGRAWFASFDNIPAALFAGVSQRCTIWIGERSEPSLFVTPMYRWRAATRPVLIPTVAFTELSDLLTVAEGIPKVANQVLYNVITKSAKPAEKQREIIACTRSAQNRLGFSPSARNFVSAFREPPPCLDDKTMQQIPTSDQGSLALSSEPDIAAAVVVVAGECFFHHWLTWGDGFHVTSGNISSFVQLLNRIPLRHFGTLKSLGACLLARRNEALVFKRNAGKYVGNFSYRGHTWLTRRSDLVLMAGLTMDAQEALELFGHVQRVLAINEFAGEKSIPESVKAKYAPVKPDSVFEKRALRDADSIIVESFGFTECDLKFLLHCDVVFRPNPD